MTNQNTKSFNHKKSNNINKFFNKLLDHLFLFGHLFILIVICFFYFSSCDLFICDFFICFRVHDYHDDACVIYDLCFVIYGHDCLFFSRDLFHHLDVISNEIFFGDGLDYLNATLVNGHYFDDLLLVYWKYI